MVPWSIYCKNMKSSQVFLREPFVSERLRKRTGTQWSPSHSQALRAAEPPSILGSKHPHALCPPLKPADISYRHTVRKGGSRSVAPKEPSVTVHLDFRFLRASSALEKFNGELLYKCASCLWYYPSLSPLQTHITLSFMEGFSCRVYYRKLKELRCRNDMKRIQATEMKSSEETEKKSSEETERKSSEEIEKKNKYSQSQIY
ncbi:uncharacterized protein LOC123482065 [Coregonus clupeaformis]|uniref:uncharacterized protein LOC123482065 n=1 Tax=Coregonus clupeaformis TaxID=59861 RepID=UPI001E1C497A|nr:uncharacterized protein LOC123482065 [Coregonus clupeaformis]